MNKLLIRTISALIFWTAISAFLHCSAFESGNAIMDVSATIVSKNICKFKTTTANLSFGVLDPLTPVDTPSSATAVFNCKGSAPIVVYLIT